MLSAATLLVVATAALAPSQPPANARTCELADAAVEPAELGAAAIKPSAGASTTVCEGVRCTHEVAPRRSAGGGPDRGLRLALPFVEFGVWYGPPETNEYCACAS